MKRVFLCLFTFCFLTNIIVAQEIMVIEDPGKKDLKTTIIFQTNGSNIPLYRPLNNININSIETNIIINQYEYIANAPVTLSLEHGLYTLSMYEPGIGSAQFSFDAVGGEQIWQLKARSPVHVPFFWISAISTTLTAFIGVYHFVNTNIWDSYENFPNSHDRPVLSTEVTLYALIGTGIVSAGSWLTFLFTGPSAQRIK